jgi:bacterioferritin-associated ferredoxin
MFVCLCAGVTSHDANDVAMAIHDYTPMATSVDLISTVAR